MIGLLELTSHDKAVLACRCCKCNNGCSNWSSEAHRFLRLVLHFDIRCLVWIRASGGRVHRGGHGPHAHVDERVGFSHWRPPPTQMWRSRTRASPLLSPLHSGKFGWKLRSSKHCPSRGSKTWGKTQEGTKQKTWLMGGGHTFKHWENKQD